MIDVPREDHSLGWEEDMGPHGEEIDIGVKMYGPANYGGKIDEPRSERWTHRQCG